MTRLFEIVLLATVTAAAAQEPAVHPVLPIGSAAPDFSLPGVDGKIHTLAEFDGSPGPHGDVHLQSLSHLPAIRRANKKPCVRL